MVKQSKYRASPETTSDGLSFGYLGKNQSVCSTADIRLRLLVAQAFRQARSELLIVSPYLIPGPVGVAGLRTLRQRDDDEALAAVPQPFARHEFEDGHHHRR